MAAQPEDLMGASVPPEVQAEQDAIEEGFSKGFEAGFAEARDQYESDPKCSQCNAVLGDGEYRRHQGKWFCGNFCWFLSQQS
jgi:hypothetical protein